jgi:hypothetical protein
MSQSRAILTLHRRTGGDTKGGRALSRRTVRTRGAQRLRGDSPRVPPGPYQQTSQFREARAGGNPAIVVGRRRRLFVFKIRQCVQAAGVPEATEGGGPGRKGGLPRPELRQESGKWRCPVVGRGLHTAESSKGTSGGAQAVTARPAGCSSAGAALSRGARPRGPPRANFCGLGGGESGCVWTCVGRRNPPPRGPHSVPAAAGAAQPRRVCAATQLARGPRPPRRGPDWKTLPSLPARGCSSSAGAKRGVRRDPLA